MTVNQIYTLLNTAYTETTGNTDMIVSEDLRDVVDLGTTIFNSSWKDNYVKNLIDQIGKMVFVDRPYEGFAPSILKSDWDYGSILAKVRAKDFEAKPNPSWSLTAGQTVDQFEYNPPEVTQTFWNMRESWQIDCSFADRQVRSAFKSAEQLNSFFTLIESTINDSRTQQIDNLIMRTFNNFMAQKINNNNNGVIDVLGMYNNAYGETLTADKAYKDPAFLRYLAFVMLDTIDQLKIKSNAYNMGGAGYTRATPKSRLHIVLNSIYGRATDVFMLADTYHNDLAKIGSYETVPLWQAYGRELPSRMETRTSISVQVGENTTVTRPYIIGIMHDEDAMAVNNTDIRVTSAYNANGEYYNNFYKVDTNCMNDLSENGVILVCGTGE